MLTQLLPASSVTGCSSRAMSVLESVYPDLSMRRLAFIAFIAVVGISLPFTSHGQAASSETPQIISLCEILKDPKAFEGKNVRFRGNISAEFEDFSVYDPSCPNPYGSGIWLMFGGDVDCPTPSTVNDVGRFPGTNVKFQGKRYALVKDDEFRAFHKFITTRKNRKSVYQVTATLEGTFFAGRTGKDARGQLQLPGYGHLGCCHLFIIHRISEVSAQKKPTV
jgi:hypothetical protein